MQLDQPQGIECKTTKRNSFNLCEEIDRDLQVDIFSYNIQKLINLQFVEMRGEIEQEKSI